MREVPKYISNNSWSHILDEGSSKTFFYTEFLILYLLTEKSFKILYLTRSSSYLLNKKRSSKISSSMKSESPGRVLKPFGTTFQKKIVHSVQRTGYKTLLRSLILIPKLIIVNLKENIIIAGQLFWV